MFLHEAGCAGLSEMYLTLPQVPAHRYGPILTFMQFGEFEIYARVSFQIILLERAPELVPRRTSTS